ncbi:MAG: DUF1592 domain-containing protein, partial [Rhodobacteraceae bacterium]|nr:DUF1592 domain-containing protein [Paracoccaceae bacterium]
KEMTITRAKLFSVRLLGSAIIPAIVLGVVLAACSPAEPTIEGGPPTMRRLSNEQYRNIIADVFGPQIDVAGKGDSLLRSDGMIAIGASTARMTPAGFEKFYKLARVIAAQVVNPQNRASEFPCAPASATAADDTCAREFYAKVGRLLYRRPLTDIELGEAVRAASDGAKTKNDFYAGVGSGLVGLLTAPQFLFITDETEPDPDHPGQERLTAYAKAARLSFFLWNTTPTDDLLNAAERGDLHNAAGLEAQVNRMMTSSRLDSGVRAFFEDFLRFEEFDTLEKDSKIYPAFTLKVIEDSREQVLRTAVDHLIAREGDYRDLFTTRKTFMTGPLARIYRVPISRPENNAWEPYEFPDNDLRAGLVSQIGFAAVASHPGRSSPTRRGRAIREALLCQKVPDPPGNVDFSKFEEVDSTDKTLRERLTAHRTEPACAGCHQLTDPIGLGLENLDGAGQLRTTENGLPIDASGDLDGIPFADAAGLGQAIRDNPATPACIVERLVSYALARTPVGNDMPYITYLQDAFAGDGYHFAPLMKRIALSRAFTAVALPNTDQANPETKS